MPPASGVAGCHQLMSVAPLAGGSCDEAALATSIRCCWRRSRRSRWSSARDFSMRVS